jgi:hypothetical protein
VPADVEFGMNPKERVRIISTRCRELSTNTGGPIRIVLKDENTALDVAIREFDERKLDDSFVLRPFPDQTTQRWRVGDLLELNNPNRIRPWERGLYPLKKQNKKNAETNTKTKATTSLNQNKSLQPLTGEDLKYFFVPSPNYEAASSPLYSINNASDDRTNTETNNGMFLEQGYSGVNSNLPQKLPEVPRPAFVTAEEMSDLVLENPEVDQYKTHSFENTHDLKLDYDYASIAFNTLKKLSKTTKKKRKIVLN